MRAQPDRPHSPEFERAALGCMLLGDLIDDPALGERTAESLNESDFYDARHRAAYRAVRELAEAGRKVNLLALVEQLKATGQLDEAGGIVYVSSLSDELPVGYVAAECVEKLRDYAGRRRLVEFGEAVAQRAAREGSIAAVTQVADATAALAGIEQDTCQLGGEFVSLSEYLAKIPEHLTRERGSALGLTTGLPKLDALTLGFSPGQAIVVAARTGGGKSAFVTHFVAHQRSKSGAKGGVVSVEMSGDEFTHRLLAHLANVDHERIRANTLAGYEREKVMNLAAELAEDPFVWIDDSAVVTAADISARARRLKVAHEIDYLVVDYLQILTGGGRAETRQLEVAESMRATKRIARELGIPVLVLSQLNRQGDSETERPRLSHLRESGAIEQDADTVILIHHPDRANWRKTELILAKNRAGATDVVECDLNGATFRFREIDQHHQGVIG